jgi:enediyne polyketide synthase
MSERHPRTPIAVIGIACHYPDARNPRELWENILSRRRAFRRIPDCRLPLADYHHEDRRVADATYGTRAALIDGFTFDWAGRRIPYQTVKSSDPVHWLALETALAAVEDAGYPPASIPGETTGVIVGNTLTGEQTRSATLRLRWPYVRRCLNTAAARCGLDGISRAALEEAMRERYKIAFPPVTEDTLAGGLANTVAGRICHYLNLGGGGYIVDGACSSSLLAAATAVDRLQQNDLDLALVGGVDVSLDPFELIGFAKTGALTPGDMSVYDRNGQGFIPGEGCAFIVLKRCEDARRDGNPVYALIHGWGISSDGRAGGITAPSVPGQVRAIRRAFARTPFSPGKLDFIEGHGTGTALGDRTELSAIQEALAADTTILPRRCGVTSLKSIIGHTKAASGIGGLIKAVMALNRRVIPPTAGCREPHELFAEKARSIYPILHGKRHDPQTVLRAGVSSMGFGGINCHLTLESADPPDPRLAPQLDEERLLASHQESEIFIVSSPSRPQLAERIAALSRTVQGISQAELTDLAADLAAQEHGPGRWRAAVVAGTPGELADILTITAEELGTSERQGAANGSNWSGPSSPPRLGMLFPGQGSQQLNMARQLVRRYPWARDMAERAAKMLGAINGQELTAWIFRDTEAAVDRRQIDDWTGALAHTAIAQPAICLASALWLRWLAELGITPTAVGGHSLGEVTALYAAGAMDFDALMGFAALRGRTMAEAAAGAMAVLGSGCEGLSVLMKGITGDWVVANRNSPVQTVLSGDPHAIDTVLRKAAELEIAGRRLNVSGAFHSPRMRPAAARIRVEARLHRSLDNPVCRIFTTLDGKELTHGTDLIDHLSRQITSPVDFMAMLPNLANVTDILIEVGPGRVLSGLSAANRPPGAKECMPVEPGAEGDRDLNRLLASLFLAGVEVHWTPLYANRLVKPFEEPSRRQFIVNLCETPVEHDDTAIPMVHCMSNDEAADTASDKSNTDVRARLLRLIAQITGFSADSIAPRARLLDDLNLDSIKAGDLLVRLAKEAGVRWPEHPSVLANASVEEIVAAVARLQVEAIPGAAGGDTRIGVREQSVGDASGIAAPGWVRNFSLQPKEDGPPIATKGFSWTGARVSLLYAFSAANLARDLELRLRANGAQVELCVASENSGEFSAEPGDGPFTHRIAIMPFKSNSFKDFNNRLNGMVALRRALAAASHAPEAGACFVQFGGGEFGRTSQSADPATAGCVALASALHLERADLRVRVIDLPVTMAVETMTDCCLVELESEGRFSAAGYDRHGGRRILRPVVSVPAEYTKREIDWSPDDVILVTGGAKGITAECAAAAARAVGAQLALLGSSPLPQKSNNPESEIHRTLERLANEGIRARYYSVDITQAQAVNATVDAIRRHQGRVWGVIHGAGLNRPRPVASVSSAEALAEIAPKVLGLFHIWNALKDQPPALIVGLSSIIGVTGMPGNAWYGFANETMDILLQAIAAEQPATSVQSAAFSIWGETGMGARMGSVGRLAHMGIDAIPTAEGTRRFVELFTSEPNSSVVVVTARLGGLDTWNMGAVRETPGRFVKQAITLTPMVEAVFTIRLTLARDPYLVDHQYNGAYLFPTVFGLEAMAQATSAVLQRPLAMPLEIGEIALRRPITVDPQEGAEIVVWAQVEERSAEAPLRVRAGIRKVEGGVTDDYFSAVLGIGSTPQGIAVKPLHSDEALPIVPTEDLYRESLLFQGARFHRIEKVYALEGNGRDQGAAELSVSRRTSAEAAKQAFPEPGDGPLALPDPFFTDALLQSAALLVPQDPCLPVAIDKLYFGPQITGLIEMCRATVVLEGCQERTFTTHVVAVDEEGKPVMGLSGYRLKILKHVDAYPRVEDLRAPHTRDRKLLAGALGEAAGAWGLELPEWDIAYLPGIHDYRREERHRLERPLLNLIGDRGCRRFGDEDITGEVEWTAAGKPTLGGSAAGRIDLSLSHDDRLCLVTAGPGLQGCDIMPVTPREPMDREALLGAKGAEILESLTAQGDDPDQAAARIWAVQETARKALGRPADEVRGVARHGAAIRFTATAEGAPPLSILTVALRLTWGTAKVVALTLAEAPRAAQTPAEYLSAYRGFFSLPAYEVVPEGPQGELIFVQRFPVTFKPGAQLSRNVYYTHYFDWMGHAREASTYPIMRDLIELLGTGRWGSVTNYSRIDILGEARTGDMIEVRMWTSANDGPCNGTMTLQYDFRRLEPDNRRTRLAFAELQTTWVELTGPGQAKAAPYPPVLQAFFDNMIPKGDAPKADESLPVPLLSLRKIDPDRLLYAAPSGPVVHPQLASHHFETALGQANAVGNVYYAKYYEWQSMLRDRYLWQLLPEYFGGTGERGEAICLSSRVDHLREAMPFDRILVTMGLKAWYPDRLRLVFDYYRAEPKQAPVKLAWGVHEMLWVKRDAAGRPAPAPLPPALGRALEKAVGSGMVSPAAEETAERIASMK